MPSSAGPAPAERGERPDLGAQVAWSEAVAGVLVTYLDPDDERLDRLCRLREG